VTPAAVAVADAPLLLAIETATRATGAALLRGETRIGVTRNSAGRPAAEVLLPAIDGLLRDHGVGLADLGGFAISIGPGSFTGLRVGLATLKGLAFGGDQPVALVSTLAALAQTSPDPTLPAVALLDARRGEAYAAVFELGGSEPGVRLAEGVYDPEVLAGKLPSECVLVGETEPFAAAIFRRLGSGVRVCPTAACAFEVGRIGARMLARGEGVVAATAVPRYLRRAEAEVVRTGHRFETPPRA
jgi:tRNA threonylcarbamoyladenosine biosynthesis protein TsaB